VPRSSKLHIAPTIFFVTYTSKFSIMKKALIITVVLAFAGFVAIANITRKDEKKTEKKMEQKTEKKKECKRSCLFS
jgi:predicted membrane protein